MARHITITPRKIAGALLATVGILFALNLAIIYLRFVMGFEYVRGFIQGFYFDNEANLPSFYSAMSIVFASVLLWLIGSTEDERRKKQSTYWRFLSFVFLFLALDEFASIHEILIQPVKSLVARSEMQSDYLYFAWFIPYSILTLILGAVYLRFFLRLPARTRWLFALSAIVFLTGAVAMEMIGGKYWAEQGWNVDGTDGVDIRYALIISVEELLEMLGIILFIYSLSGYYLAKTQPTFHVTLADTESASTTVTQTFSQKAHP